MHHKNNKMESTEQTLDVEVDIILCQGKSQEISHKPESH